MFRDLVEPRGQRCFSPCWWLRPSLSRRRRRAPAATTLNGFSLGLVLGDPTGLTLSGRPRPAQRDSGPLGVQPLSRRRHRRDGGLDLGCLGLPADQPHGGGCCSTSASARRGEWFTGHYFAYDGGRWHEPGRSHLLRPGRARARGPAGALPQGARSISSSRSPPWASCSSSRTRGFATTSTRPSGSGTGSSVNPVLLANNPPCSRLLSRLARISGEEARRASPAAIRPGTPLACEEDRRRTFP